MDDPRFKNALFEGSSVKEYLGNYADKLRSALIAIPGEGLEAAIDALWGAIRDGKNVLLAGNGGSAAIAAHTAADWAKGTYLEGQPPLKVRDLVSNVAVLTSVANDSSYEKLFSSQLAYFASSGDLLFLISSSGNSPNIVEAAIEAKRLGLVVVGLTGFGGGKLKGLCDISIHVDVSNYGLVEDAHAIVFHAITQSINKVRD